jgi:hypothetical protein
LRRISLVIALNCIALVFAVDFIEGPLKRGGVTNYPLSYLPFALMPIVGPVCVLRRLFVGTFPEPSGRTPNARHTKFESKSGDLTHS